MTNPRAILLRNGGTSVVLALSGEGLPAVVHWGADLGALEEPALRAIVTATSGQRVSGGLDSPARLTLLPQESEGWQGTPGLTGSRDGRDFSPRFSSDTVDHTASTLEVSASDRMTGLALTISVRVTDSGLVTQQVTITNTGTAAYQLDELALTFPLPASATEILDTYGRHLRERTPQRHTFTFGRHVREGRRGRPGFDSTLLLAAGVPGFGFERGLVHGVHFAWSGNHRVSAERGPDTAALLRAAELLGSREVVLAPGASYSTPLAIGSWGDGLNELSARFHEHLRGRPRHPATPRKVTLNTWEAVYFDHDLAGLTALADAAASVGVERFVLDDGWFRGRRDDTAGLGDWYVDDALWPAGLHPLFDHVMGLGLECGLWVEPEMVNLDSDLARAHPDWILQTPGRLPVSGRQQQVLDLSNPDVWHYLLERLDALLTEYPIRYLKWDHNRDLLEAGNLTGSPAVHATVLALYRLFDELAARHPGLELESCASGGARVDLGILDRTDRVWTSDCIDPVERLTIQRYTALVVPPELMGQHIGGPVSHSTGRHHDLSFRAGVALFGHLGIEWDISAATVAERDELSSWVALHTKWRPMLHTGRLVSADLSDPSMDLRGVVAADARSAVFVFSQVSASAAYPPGLLHFPGLDADTVYSVRLVDDPATSGQNGQSPLLWTEEDVHLTGQTLAIVGVQAPVLFPEHLVVIELTAVSALG